MFAASKSGGVVSSGDPYWTSVSLLTNFENNLTFQDGSTNNFAITRNGTVNPSLNTPFSGGVGGSEWFNGASRISAPNNAALQFGSGNFTIELWFYLSSISGTKNLVQTSNVSFGDLSYSILVSGTSCVYYLSSTGAAWNIASGVSIGTVAANTWYHVALVRNGTTITPYLNGVAGTTTTTSATLYAFTSPVNFGGYPAGIDFLTGNISNARIVKGTAVYTTTFTPPTAPLTAITNTSLLITGTGQGMFNNSTFVDQGPNALTVTATGAPVYSGLSPFGNTYAGSVLFNGTSQYLSTPDSTAFTLGSGNFTVETWIYNGTTGARQVICGQIDSAGTIASLSFYLEKTAANKFLAGVASGGTSYTATSTADLPLNQWTHLAFVRNGNTGTLYINGAADGTVNLTGVTVNDSTNAFSIGRLGEFAGLYFPGYISNARIVKGTAVYTTGFTPSTTPLTAITNTSLLVRGDTGAFYDLSNVGNPESGTGSATVTTQVKKFGNESSSFNNSTTYITAPDNTSLNMGASDFTVECWVYLNATPSALQVILDKDGKSAVSWAQYELSIDTAKKINAIISTTTTSSPPGTPTVRIIGATILNTGQWYFVALTRVGVNATLWVGGVSDGTSSAVPATLNTRNGSLYVGYADSAAAGSVFNGYLDDIRITKGVARYTANFTPPTATFPTGP